MTSPQESRLSMYLTFKEYQAPYTTITNALPNYPANSTILLNTIPQIQAIAEQQKMSKKGITDGKNSLKESLIVTAADYARKLGAYAKFTNNATLAQEVKFTESKLRQVADTAVKDYAQIVYDRAQPIVASLATYGITAATQTALLAAITAYNASIGKPGAGRSEGTQITKQLVALFKTADTALANMDAAVEIVRLTQVNFYNGYKSARKVIETGAGSLSVKGMVTDAKTGAPLKGVTVSFALDGGMAKAKAANNKPDVVKKTADKGGFNIKSLPAGTYQVTLKKVGYADQVVTISVNDGEMTELNISL
ncbi:MAG: carboxypeptidase-like regulatory domain-containing protein [Minisyncoccota bacterium]